MHDVGGRARQADLSHGGVAAEVIRDRGACRPGSWEGESKPLDLDRVILSYVVPLIAAVRITFEARLS